jgi:CRISPR-associated protein Cmr1
MKTIRIECRVITPMFLTGADGKTPELRAPSLKGAMRFWWRAMHGHLSLKELKEEESKIFGGSGEKEGRSSFSIKIKEIEILNEGIYQPLPHHTNNWCNSAKGCIFKRGKCTKSYKSACISVNSRFETEILLNDPLLECTVKNLFILTSVLGGLGKRARRGFGSFKILKINNTHFSNDNSLKSICNLLNSVSNIFKNTNNISLNTEVHPTANYPYIKEIRIGKEDDSYEGLLNTIGHASHDHNDNSLGFARGRLASPIYVSLIEDSQGYKPIITTLNTAFENSNWSVNENKQNDFKGEIL